MDALISVCNGTSVVRRGLNRRFSGTGNALCACVWLGWRRVFGQRSSGDERELSDRGCELESNNTRDDKPQAY